MGDKLPLQTAEQPALTSAKTDAHDWLVDDVWRPFVNGTGVLQVYNTFSSNPVAIQPEAQEKPFSLNWAVQSLSSAAGAIIPYVIAGKVAGAGLRSIGEEVGAQGAAAKYFFASENAAQILGAGAYEFLKKPLDGETRVGNAAGTMLGFGVFAGGNALVDRLAKPWAESAISNAVSKSVGRFTVGAAGGLASYEASNKVAAHTGGKDQSTTAGALQSMASGGFINFALPPLQQGANKLIDLTINSKPWGKGIPIDRQLRYSGLSDPEVNAMANENLLARVKSTGDAETARADVKNNVVEIGSSGSSIAKLAHELRHLQLAKQFEPAYDAVANTLKTNPAAAEQQFYSVREHIEQGARQTENRVAARSSGNDAAPQVVTTGLGDQVAGNGRTYSENWKDEWNQFKSDPSFRPPYEYSDPSTAQTAAGTVVPLDKATWGSPDVLGATVTDQGINFAIHSAGANKVDLLLFNSEDAQQPSQVLSMNRTGDTWHRFVPDMPAGTTYLYRAYGNYDPASDGSRYNGNKVLLDPYAKALTGDTHSTNGDELGYDDSNPDDPNRHLRPSTIDNINDSPRAVAVRSNFDWQGDKPPGTSMQDSVIYEMNLRAFTGKAGDLSENLRGTYRGMIQKIPYLKQLGVTAVELMPIMEFDKSDWWHNDPVTGQPLYDSWGYNTVGYQAPESRFAADGRMGQQVDEFKELVRELHKNDIEVLLDVVFNHTREGDQFGPTFSFRGLDNKDYYMLMPGHPDLYENHTGCGNTVSANNPVVQRLILDSLRYWVNEMHVDGFRFDLATIFKYDVDGQQRSKTPIISAIENDPVLSKVKLIAEPWGPDQYYLGQFSDKTWAEWNDKFRDGIRRFVKGDDGQAAALGDRIAGSPGMFDESKGRNTVNFVTAHDGFTLNDLVSYNTKHNERNGENNNDGNSSNYSWNGGYEGSLENASLSDADKTAIENLRNRQMKNMMSMLMLSRGTPMMLYGDEVRRTANGNNNAWCQDTLNMLDWGSIQHNSDMLRFTQMMIDLRKSHQIGRLGTDSIVWHGVEPEKPDWSDSSHFLAWQYKAADANHKSLYIASNAYWEPLKANLPPGRWHRLVDTNLPNGPDIVTRENATPIDGNYVVQPRSTVVLEAD